MSIRLRSVVRALDCVKAKPSSAIPSPIPKKFLHIQQRSLHIPTYSEAMEAVKTTIAENVGKFVPAHELAPEDSKFSLDQVPNQTGKVAIVTGGSEGVGYGCVYTLLKNNISKLFILSRTKATVDIAMGAIKQDLGEGVAKKVEWIQCDLSDWEATGKTAFDITTKTDRLDILINCAARGIMTQQFDKNGVDLHVSGNHIGHVILTSHLLPLLKKTSKASIVRIVNLSSNAHPSAPGDVKFESLEELNKDYGPMGQYGRSKLATLLYSKYLNRHLTSQNPNILANATHPGFVDTRQSTEHILEAYPVAGYAMTHGMNPLKKDIWEGCVSTMFAATKTEKSGQYICPPAIVEQGSPQANDEELGERLMELTWKLAKEKTKSQSADKGCTFKES